MTKVYIFNAKQLICLFCQNIMVFLISESVIDFYDK